jgi:hypothetical protein
MAKEKLKQLQDLIGSIQKSAQVAQTTKPNEFESFETDDDNEDDDDGDGPYGSPVAAAAAAIVNHENNFKSPMANRASNGSSLAMLQKSLNSSTSPKIVSQLPPPTPQHTHHQQQQPTNKSDENLDLSYFSDTGSLKIKGHRIDPPQSIMIHGNDDDDDNDEDEEGDDDGAFSPSDNLWSQMKHQLHMRDQLRGNKKELEELIQKERFLYERLNEKQQQQHNTGVAPIGQNDDENDDEEQFSENSDEDDRVPQASKKQQENLCSADELIITSDQGRDRRQTRADPIGRFTVMVEKHFHELKANQQQYQIQMIEQLQSLKSQATSSQQQQQQQQHSASAVQFQMQNDMYLQHNSQIQIQQLIFNLNAAYRELSIQRNDINTLTQKLNELTGQVNSQKPQSISVVDDKSKAQQLASNPTASRQRHTSTSSTSTSPAKTNVDPSRLKGADHMHKTVTTNVVRNSGSLSSNSASVLSLNFDELREKIYSEVASLISQNETRPQYLLNLFRELQNLKTKNSRDQALKSIFNISTRYIGMLLASIDIIILFCMNNLNKKKRVDADKPGQETTTTTTVKPTMTSAIEENKTRVITLQMKPKPDEIANQVMSIMNRFIRDFNISLKLYINPQYINDLINRLVNILKEKDQFDDYLRLYQNQLCSYVKEVSPRYVRKVIENDSVIVVVNIF